MKADLRDLGLTEYMFDVVYVTWITHVLVWWVSSWFWWVYAVIPSYALFKAYSFIQEQRQVMSSRPNQGEVMSKTQLKKQKRQHHGHETIKYTTY